MKPVSVHGLGVSAFQQLRSRRPETFGTECREFLVAFPSGHTASHETIIFNERQKSA